MTTVITLLTRTDTRMLKDILGDDRFVLEPKEDLKEAHSSLLDPASTVVFIDEANNWRGFMETCEDRYQPKVLLCSRHRDWLLNSLWAEAFNLGVYDLLSLPFEPETVRRVMVLATALKVKTAR